MLQPLSAVSLETLMQTGELKTFNYKEFLGLKHFRLSLQVQVFLQFIKVKKDVVIIISHRGITFRLFGGGIDAKAIC